MVESSVGHIRDMPDSAAEIPAKYQGEPWARLGVNVDDNFQALYVVHSDKRQQVSKLKSLLKDADELLLATDEDREGEAIAWHLLQELKPTVPTSRMVFHEITPEAIARAIANPREVDDGLVDAYQARRVLDRLYGYEVSPVLWKKVMPKLSAGRVQSVATRLVVDRERERIAFRAATYSDLEAEFATKDHGKASDVEPSPTSFTANLVSVDGKPGRPGPRLHLRRRAARRQAPMSCTWTPRPPPPWPSGSRARTSPVASVERKPYRRSPYAPFRTTTLQQEASRQLGFSAKHTMSIAQRLYENGYITYMRTDSVTLSQTAISAARKQAAELYGANYVPDAPRTYASKVKNAQEAHEAIRPAGDSFRTPRQVAGDRLSSDERRLYELIWQRTVASQMKDATGESVSVRVAGTSTAGERAEFGATGKVINFYGFLKAYVEGADDPTPTATTRSAGCRRWPRATRSTCCGSPPPSTPPGRRPATPRRRWSRSSKTGRSGGRPPTRPSSARSWTAATCSRRAPRWSPRSSPSPWSPCWNGTSASWSTTSSPRGWRTSSTRSPAARPSGCPGCAGSTSAPTTRDDDPGLKSLVGDISDIDARDVSSFPLAGSDIVVRVGRYGPYLERDGQRVNVPEDIAPDELTVEKAEELFNQPNGDVVLGTDPDTGREVVAKAGRFGPYVTEQLPDDAPASAKPRTASLLKSMALDTVTLDDALKLLSLPRMLGELDGEQVTVQNGRYGPYAKKGSDSRSLESEDQLFTLTLAEAKELFAQPKPRGRRAGAAAPPLRELGEDPATGKPMVIKDGRFGPYVTDGETNASLRKGDEVASITVQRAAELLADRRAAPPPATRRRSHDQPRRKLPPRPVRHQKDLDLRCPGPVAPFGPSLKSRSRTNPLCGQQCRYSYAVNFRAAASVGAAPTGGSPGAAPRGATMPASRACCRSSRSGGCGSRCPCPAWVTG